MARERVSDSFVLNGQPVVGATVEVFDFGTTTPVAQTLYAGATGGTTFNGVTDAAGRFELYVATGARFSVRITHPDITTATLTYESQPDPADVIKTSGSQSRASGLTTEGQILDTPTINGAIFTGMSLTNPTVDGGSWLNGTLTTPSVSGGTWATPTMTTPSVSGLATFADRVLVNDRAYIRGAYAHGADASPNGRGRGGLVVTSQGEVAVGLAAATYSTSDAISPNHVMQVTWNAEENEQTLPFDVYLQTFSWGAAESHGVAAIITGTLVSATNDPLPGSDTGTITVPASTFPTAGSPRGGVGGLTTLAGTHWIKIISGPGAGQVRRITVQTTDTGATVSPAWTVGDVPTGSSTYRIAREVDLAAGSFFNDAQANSIGIIRGAQIHALRRAGSYGTKVQGIELAVETAVRGEAEDYAVGLYCLSYATHLTGGVGVQANTGLWVGGSLGFDRYLGCYTGFADNTKVAEILKAGHLNTVGKGTFGQIATGSALLNLKQLSGDSTNSGLQIARNASDNKLAVFMGGDNAVYFQNLQTAGAETARLMLGGTATSGTIVSAHAPSGHTGHLLDLVSSAGVRANVRIDGQGDFTLAGIATFYKASGAISDVDFSVTPLNGAIGVRGDGGAGTTLYVRKAGSWSAIA